MILGKVSAMGENRMAKIERAKNASRNMFFGIILKIYQILVPFFMRTAMICLLGVQYLGLNSLFTSVLQVLNLAELGVGSAMVYSMYQPIAQDDNAAVCALMKLYRTYYRLIGAAIALIGGTLTPFIPVLISGEVPPDIDIYLLYWLNLGATVLSYWMFAYKNSILQAHQRTDVISKITLITNTFQYGLQLLILFTIKNYYVYVIVMLATQAITNIATAIAADKMYPQFKPVGEVREEELHRISCRIRDLFTSKIGSIIYDSADTIVISAFLGLTVLSVYQNYFYILTAVSGMISVMFSSCTAGIGNSIVAETKEKNYRDLKQLTFMISWIAGVCSAAMLCLYQPFMELWVGKKLMLSVPEVVCFVLYFFVRQYNSLFNLYKDASGMWHEDRFRPLAAAVTNLILNLISVQLIGIYGILLSTVLAIVCVGMPWLMYNLFSIVFDRKHLFSFVRRIGVYCSVVLISCAVTYGICYFIDLALIPTLIVRGLICVMIPNLIYYIVFRNSTEFHQLLEFVGRIAKSWKS